MKNEVVCAKKRHRSRPNCVKTPSNKYRTWTNSCFARFSQIKDPLAAELQDLAEEALAGVDSGAEPKPEKYIELVFGQEIVELEGFMAEIKVQ